MKNFYCRYRINGEWCDTWHIIPAERETLARNKMHKNTKGIDYYEDIEIVTERPKVGIVCGTEVAN